MSSGSDERPTRSTTGHRELLPRHPSLAATASTAAAPSLRAYLRFPPLLLCCPRFRFEILKFVGLSCSNTTIGSDWFLFDNRFFLEFKSQESDLIRVIIQGKIESLCAGQWRATSKERGMPKRRRGERDGGRTAERPRQRHLYLVFDDWGCGYSIRKVKLPSDSGAGAEQRLPHALFGVVAQRRFPHHITSAFGSRIIDLHPNKCRAAQIIDVRTRSIVFGPVPNYPDDPIYFSVGGDKLFALDSGTFDFCPWPVGDDSPLEQPDAEFDSDGVAAATGHGASSQGYHYHSTGWMLPPTPCTPTDRPSSSAPRLTMPSRPHSPSTRGSLCGNVLASGCCPSGLHRPRTL
ncbi:hypothetical protein BAE44_0006063 [Dichanthelium oligosanthes]|uniref:Uncharacterized protein n=1 Tax=Dichanthelium oligosanthes TaxID=888268 RepID=A0A1E5W6B6_9POAL|nr:hypothetical protein BAE44_0006063 [Dichanthelium oligosanthes]